MKKFINKSRQLGYVVFGDGSTQFLMFNQSIQSDLPVKKVSKTITVIEIKQPRKSRTESSENIGVE
jgi:hypothetical protein